MSLYEEALKSGICPQQAMKTIRLQTNTGQWKPFRCEPSEQTGDSALLNVPELNGVWYICKTGMTANIGGNDWRIYTLHPDDCAILCNP